MKNIKILKLGILTLFLIIITLSTSINAEITGSIDSNLNFTPEDEEKVRNMGYNTIETLDQINQYAQDKFQPDSNNQRAIIKINEQTGLITIESPPGTVYASIPKGVNADHIQGKLVFSGKAEDVTLFPGSETIDTRTGRVTRINPVSGRPLLKINGFEIDAEKQFRLEVSEENGIRSIEVTSGTIDIFTGSTTLNGISEARLKINEENEVTYAKFKSPKGGEYKLTYNGKEYDFQIEEGGELIFNPEANQITGTKIATLELDNQRIRISKFDSITLDENGDIKLIDLAENGKYEEDGYVYSAKKGEKLKVFVNQDIPEDEKNAIAIRGEKVELKGLVEVKDGLNYKALSQDALTEFDKSKDFFDVKKGDVKLNNDAHEVLIKDGKVKLSTLNLNKDGKKSFGFAYEEGDIFGEVDEEGGDLKLFAFKDRVKGDLIGSKNFIQAVGASFTGKDAISQLDLDNHRQNIQTQISEKNTEIQDIDQQIAQLISEGKERTTQIQELRTQKATKQKELSNLQNQQIESESANLPRLYSITNQATSYSLAGSAQNDQKIDLEVDPSGNVRAYYYNGKRYKINGDQTELPNTLAFGNKALIQELINNGANINNLQNSDHAQSLQVKGYSYDSQEYKDLSEKTRQTRQTLVDARNHAQQTGNIQLLDEIDLEIANTFLSSKDFEEAKNRYNILLDSDLTSEVETKVRVLLTSTLLQENLQNPSRESSLLIQSYLNQLGAAGKQLESEYIRTNLKNLEALARKETALTNQESSTMYGDGHGAWRNVGDVLSVMFQPATNSYLVLQKHQEILDQMQQNYDVANTRLIAAQQMTRLLDAGIDLKQYAESPPFEQVLQIYRANGHDTLLSVKEIRSYQARFGSDYQAMIEAIKSDHSSYVADQFDSHFKRSLFRANSITDTIQNDPTTYQLVSKGESIQGLQFQGDLNEAFQQVRLGKAIEYTGLEKGLLMAGDVVLNPLTYVGATAAFRAAGTKGVATLAGTDLGTDVALSLAPPEVQATVAVATLGLLGTQGAKKVVDFARGGSLKIGLTRKGNDLAQVFTGSERSLSKVEDMLKAQKAVNKGNGIYELDRKTFVLRKDGAEMPSRYRGDDAEFVDSTQAVTSSKLRESVESTSQNARTGQEFAGRQRRVEMVGDPELAESMTGAFGSKYSQRFLSRTETPPPSGNQKKFLDDMKDKKQRTYEVPPNKLEKDARKYAWTYGGLLYQNKLRTFSSEHIIDGKLMTYGVPANGKFVWTIDNKGNFKLGIRESQDVALPHSALADGRPVFGAGEVEFKNGKVTMINAHSGHYVPSGAEGTRELMRQFNSDSTNSFVEYGRMLGLEFDNSFRIDLKPPATNPGRGSPVSSNTDNGGGSQAWLLD